MAFSLSATLARWLYNRAARDHRQSHSALEPGWRIEIWQEMNITLATRINPFVLAMGKQRYASTRDTDYHVALHPLDRSLEPALESAFAHYEEHQASKQGEPLNRAAKDFRKAAFRLYRVGLYEEALRSFLNALHLDITAVSLATAPADKARANKGDNLRSAGHCLIELGDANTAARYYAKAATEFMENNSQLDAALCFELAALAWEAAPVVQGQRPGGLVDSLAYDSTVCYQKAKTLFSTTGDYDAASRCFIQERDTQARWTRSTLRAASLRAMRMAWLYGESPTSAFLLIVYWWFAFAVLFFFTGFKTDTSVIRYSLSDVLSGTTLAQDFATALYFSAVTMSTLGYGDYAPASNLSRFFSGMEAFLGVILVAMFIVAVQRRYVGR